MAFCFKNMEIYLIPSKTITCSILAGKLECRRNFGRYSLRWQDNIESKLKGIGWERVGWISVAQDGEN